jgi:hypothetical protein
LLLLLLPATNTSIRMPYFGCRLALTQINAFDVRLHMIFFLRMNGGVEINTINRGAVACEIPRDFRDYRMCSSDHMGGNDG